MSVRCIVRHWTVMSTPAAEPTTPRDPKRSLRDLLDSFAEYRQREGIAELTDDEAMELAAAETRAVRRELRERGEL